jgi:NAD(P)-dependent dehydrogenase (short-subunit alcohol dehydrogenase family)
MIFHSGNGTLSDCNLKCAGGIGARKITANIIAPDAIETDLSGGMVRANPKVNKMVPSMTALGRPGLPDGIGRAVAMRLAPESGWINGQRIEVSGGMAL